MWVVDPKLYYMGCRRNLKYIFVDGGVKRKLNYIGGGVDKKCLPRWGAYLFLEQPLFQTNTFFSVQLISSYVLFLTFSCVLFIYRVLLTVGCF